MTEGTEVTGELRLAVAQSFASDGPLGRADGAYSPREAQLTTDVYQEQLASADELIDQLIRANLASGEHRTAQR